MTLTNVKKVVDWIVLLLNSGERYGYWTGDQPVSGNSKTEWESLWFVGNKNEWKLKYFRALKI